MANESIDISSVKHAALASIEIPEQGSNDDVENARQIKAVQAALQRVLGQPDRVISNNRSSHVILPETQRNTLSDLPSTVLDSQQLAHAASLMESMQPQAIQSLQKPRTMSSQIIAADATQELSPSYYDALISKSRSANPANGIHENEDKTQQTLNEGDEGHVDLTSSFIPLYPDDEELESEPTDFFPSQTQHPLSQFPESQRFKTPATFGKKRNYNGEILDSPELPRNPLLRNGAPTPKQVMALSEAFAATQAGSSPFIDRTVVNPSSDRPSPNIELQTRPASATISSPLRPISEFRRGTTEPGSKYISMKQSQAERARRAQLRTEEDEEDGESDDDFDEEPSIIRKDKMRRERERKVKEQFQMLSSPSKRSYRGKDATQFSPIHAPETSTPQLGLKRRISQKSEQDFDLSLIDDPEHDIHESEQDTEQEDENELVEKSSHIQNLDEEDKENCVESAIQIPQTTLRLQRVPDDIPNEIEASPSLRHEVVGVKNVKAVLESSEPFAVANSQPSQPAVSQGTRQQPKSSGVSEGVEVIPQSQDDLKPVTAFPSTPHGIENVGLKNESSNGNARTSREKAFSQKDRAQRDVFQTSSSDAQRSSAPAHLGSTIPETFSGICKVDENKEETSTSASAAKPTAASVHTEYETAPTYLESSVRLQLPEMSSPPITTTPPGCKRKRMSEIAAAESPHQSSLGFDASDALQLEPELLSARFQSPTRLDLRYSKRIKFGHWTPGLSQTSGSEPVEPIHALGSDANLQTADQIDGGTEQIAVGDSPNSQKQSKSPLQKSGLRSARRGTNLRVRSSTWDFDMSPPSKAVPVLKPRVSLARKTDLKKAHKESPGSSSATPPTTQTSERRNSPTKAIDRESPDALAIPVDADPEIIVQKPVVDIIAPDMVFACFNGKTRAYYPARCLGVADKIRNRYKIQWEGYDPDVVDMFGVRRLEVHIGDLVKIDLKGFAKVAHFIRGFKDKQNPSTIREHITDVQGHKTLLVSPKQRRSLPADISTEIIKEVPISAIYLDSNMWQQMKDRTYVYCPPPSTRSSLPGYATPVERASTPSTPSSRNRRQAAALIIPTLPASTGIFTNMVFAISYEEPTRKCTITDLIQSNGGTILQDSFMGLLEHDTIFPHSQFANAGFTVLLTDRHSRKVKYVQALALGLPCLSGRWIEACAKSKCILDWQTYLLPAGESDELEGATRSRVMAPMDPIRVKLVDMVQARPLVLREAAVVVVMGRGKVEIKRKAYLFLIQALGAARIEKVTDLKAAKDVIDADGDAAFDFVFVDDRDVGAMNALVAGGKNRRRRQCKVAGNEFVMQSLILGKLYRE